MRQHDSFRIGRGARGVADRRNIAFLHSLPAPVKIVPVTRQEIFAPADNVLERNLVAPQLLGWIEEDDLFQIGKVFLDAVQLS